MAQKRLSINLAQAEPEKKCSVQLQENAEVSLFHDYPKITLKLVFIFSSFSSESSKRTGFHVGSKITGKSAYALIKNTVETLDSRYIQSFLFDYQIEAYQSLR